MKAVRGSLLSMQLEGFDEIMAKLEGGRLYAGPWKAGMSEVGNLGLEHAQERAPYRKGGLERSLIKKMDPHPIPMYVKVTTNVTKKGFRYGGALEGGERYHYRSGPYRGRPTKKWLSGVIDLIQREVNQILKSVAREIEQRWAA